MESLRTLRASCRNSLPMSGLMLAMYRSILSKISNIRNPWPPLALTHCKPTKRSRKSKSSFIIDRPSWPKMSVCHNSSELVKSDCRVLHKTSKRPSRSYSVRKKFWTLAVMSWRWTINVCNLRIANLFQFRGCSQITFTMLGGWVVKNLENL